MGEALKADTCIHGKRPRHLVCDVQDGHLSLEPVDRAGQLFRGVRIEIGGRFVKDQDPRLFQQCTRDGDALALAAGEADTLFADAGLVALWQLLDGLVDAGGAAGRDRYLSR